MTMTTYEDIPPVVIDLAETREAVIAICEDPWNIPDNYGIEFPERKKCSKSSSNK